MAKQGQVWLAGKLGITQGRVAQLVKQGRIPKRREYGAADVTKAKKHLLESRANNNATAADIEDQADGGDHDAIEALSKNPEKVARIRLIVERTAKIKLERELLAGGYIKKEDKNREDAARVYSVRAKLQEIPLRASLIAHKSEAECERILEDWVREICDYYAQGGN